MMKFAAPLAAAFLLLPLRMAYGQILQIDGDKLPQDNAVQRARADLLPIKPYARTWTQKWPYPIPKAEVESRFSTALHKLERAQKQSPENFESRS